MHVEIEIYTYVYVDQDLEIEILSTVKLYQGKIPNIFSFFNFFINNKSYKYIITLYF